MLCRSLLLGAYALGRHLLPLLLAQRMLCLPHFAHADHRGAHVLHYVCDCRGQDFHVGVEFASHPTRLPIDIDEYHVGKHLCAL